MHCFVLVVVFYAFVIPIRLSSPFTNTSHSLSMTMLPLTGLAVRVKRSYGSVGERMSNSHGSWVQHYSASTFWAFPLHAGNDSNIAIMHCIFLAYAMLTCGIEASLFHAHVDVVSRPLVRFINEYSRDRLLIAYPHR